MHVRVVRFTDVDADRLDQMLGEIDQAEGPPEGVEASRMQILVDRDQGTSVVLQFFDSEEAMRNSEQALDSMDPSETPGNRASVDRCEMKLEMSA